MSNYEVIFREGNKPIKAWVKGVPEIEESARQQLINISSLPFIYKHVAVMPDCHLGKGATVGSVVPTKGAIIPAAVGVDLGCGLNAVRTTLTSHDLPESLKALRLGIESEVPVGEGKSRNVSASLKARWYGIFEGGYKILKDKYPAVESKRSYPVHQLGTLGGGNHFIEICLDEEDRVWVMLHSGSRGIGNRIGNIFISLAKKEMEKYFIHLPDKDLAYLSEDTELFNDYVDAVSWAQDYAAENRKVMISDVINVMRKHFKPFKLDGDAVSVHHNYIAKENHFGENIWITRKGAVRAREGDIGILPASMGKPSYIVRGKGCTESFCSAPHGAGRAMSRNAAKQRFSLDDHIAATKGVECRKDEGVIDETPMAYKDIRDVLKASEDLVEVVHELRQVLCCKG